jgi:hypothetical protein
VKEKRKNEEQDNLDVWHPYISTSCGPRGRGTNCLSFIVLYYYYYYLFKIVWSFYCYCSPKFVSCLGLKKFVFVCLFNYFNFKKMGCIFTSCDFMDATLHVCLHFACSVMCLILLHIVHDEWNNSSFFLHVIYCWMVVLFKMLNLKICCWFFFSSRWDIVISMVKANKNYVA